jgi:hypothetical protein
MKLNSLTFVDGDDGAEPDTVTVTMTIFEAAVIASLFGKLNSYANDKIALDYDIYGCLVGDVFNRYWDDGLNDAYPHLQWIKLATINDKQDIQVT